MRLLRWLYSHIGNNQDWYIWPLATVGFFFISVELVYFGSGRAPIADLKVNLQAINGYAIEGVPIFISLFWASLAGRFLAWNFKTQEAWELADWQKQLIDIAVPLIVFIVCMHHFDIRS